METWTGLSGPVQTSIPDMIGAAGEESRTGNVLR
jgi:hypothetical protein